MVIEVEVVVNSCRGLPVSSSVTFILYSRIIPFCSLSDGGSHESNTVVELCAVPVGFSGALVGTAYSIYKRNT